MTTDDAGLTARDLLDEISGTAAAATARAEFFRAPAPQRRWRDVVVSETAQAGTGAETGRALVGRRPPDLRQWYETLLWQEAAFPPDREFAFLVSPACQIVEREVEELFCEPARAVAGAAVDVLRADPGKREQAEILERWKDRRSWGTLGTADLLLLALRRAATRGDETVGAFLADAFSPAFVERLTANALAPGLSRLVRQRNDACHGKRAFDAAAYEAFVRLAVGHRRFGDWHDRGPAAVPPPAGEGFLHQLLTGSRRLPPAADEPAAAVTRLLDLARPRRSAFAVSVLPAHAATAGRLRDVTVSDVRADAPFRLGDPICFAVRADRDCHLTLIDVGTTGTVAVLLPNRWSPEPGLTAGVTRHLPDLRAPEFRLTLSGRPGQERVIAVATLAPPPVLLRPEGGAAFRVLDETAAVAFAVAVERLDPASWAAASCEFEIELA